MSAVILLLLFCPFPDDKAPTPSKEDQTKIRERLRELFKAEYAKSSAAELRSVAEKLLNAASEEKDNPGNRFVMLSEAMLFASMGGDVEKAVSAASEIQRDFNCPDLNELLGNSFADGFNSKELKPDLAKVAAQELSKKSSLEEKLAIAKAWSELGIKIKTDYKISAFRRSRSFLLDALQSGDLKGLQKTETEQMCQIVNREIDKCDMKSSRFSLYEGKWTIKYANGWTHEYDITADGSLTFTGISNEEAGVLDVDKFLKYDKKAKLTRSSGVILVRFNRGRIIEKLSLEGDKLLVERFDPANLYPNNPNNKGEGVKLK